ncbi:hypothetical protein WS71_04565 [Burkholderia mayonis]|uniref:MFS transporter n=1 Tax=Burkholderia mayonis TaxID=1385591 RepID=A0A1B4FSK6_9BURK|nr:hypothetical protein WS71_04565 [Burkholderia mayonis]KVE57370.1 hypothetical protein WS71_28000 [Burkholderia mayonis]
MPFSGYHKLIFVIIAIAFFFDSVDLGTMTFVLGSIKKEFGLSIDVTNFTPHPYQNLTFNGITFSEPT